MFNVGKVFPSIIWMGDARFVLEITFLLGDRERNMLLKSAM
jgi:hypothetical protein